MKKLAFLFLFGIAVANAQDKSSTDTIAKKSALQEEVEAKLEFGVFGNVNADLNINQKLSSQNLPQLSSFLPGLGAGFNAFGKKLSTGFMVVFLYDSSSKDNHKLLYNGLDGRMFVHYNLVNKEKLALTGGLNITASGSYFNLYRNNSTVDMNNLTPDANPGQITFYNSMFYMGPFSVCIFLQKIKTSIKA